MIKILRYFLFLTVLSFVSETTYAQVQNYKELHKVKKKETIFGIAHENGVTIQELINANPEMNAPDYELKKGDYIKIPYPSANQQTAAPSAVQQPQLPAAPSTQSSDVRHREVRIGVMLPLHTLNGDGKRMVEYYRGVLMACDSLKANGISTDIRAWNLAEDGNVDQVLSDAHAADRDIIIGPLYTKQVKALATFARQHDIKLLIPFSISSNEVYDNPSVFQVFQNGNTLNHAFVYQYTQRFKGCRTIVIDCNDTTTTKGPFTAALRRQLEQEGADVFITNLKTSEGVFKKAFSTTKRNVVVLNTSRQQELNIAFAKINGLMLTTPGLQISMFGYPEWLQYTRRHLDDYYKFDTYIPSTYYRNPLSDRVVHFKKKYRWNFHQDMQQQYPQFFAMTGFDQTYFMVKGLHLYGTNFTGSTGMVGYTPVQQPLHFERIGNGGLQNKAIVFVHYTPTNRIETINF